MAFVDEEKAQAYREAWDGWMKQVQHVNRVFLEGEEIRPEQLKGLLNREARWKERYDQARLQMLGLDQSPLSEVAEGENPFR